MLKIQSHKANMKGWLWHPNDTRGICGPKTSRNLSYRWIKTLKNLTQDTCPDRDGTRTRYVTGAHATACFTAMDAYNSTRYKLVCAELTFKFRALQTWRGSVLMCFLSVRDRLFPRFRKSMLTLVTKPCPRTRPSSVTCPCTLPPVWRKVVCILTAAPSQWSNLLRAYVSCLVT